MMLTSKENNNLIANISDNLSEIMNDRCKIATYFLSPLSEITNPERTSQYKLIKDPDSNE